jgi:hypothetical protein
MNGSLQAVTNVRYSVILALNYHPLHRTKAKIQLYLLKCNQWPRTKRLFPLQQTKIKHI